MTLRIPIVKYPGDNGTQKFPDVAMLVDQDGNYVDASGGGGGGGSSGIVSDPALEAAVGTPTDTPWTSGAGTLVGLGKRTINLLSAPLAVVQNGVWAVTQAGAWLVGATQSGQWFESPFLPIAGATSGLTVGPTATGTPLALGAYTASTYRIRNSASSASPVAWRLATTNTGQSAVMPVAASTAGTGGTVGDKSIDPGGVEVFTLSAAQQAALAAGTLYLSAITSASGSATIYVTPGTAGR